jgi:N-acetylmuramic acid 6-phosphate etherase
LANSSPKLIKARNMSNTEFRDPRFADIDVWPTVQAIETMLEGQIEALQSIRAATHAIAGAAEASATRLSSGGRLIYTGAGTSGRVAVQDGVELGPTFGWPEQRLCYLLAGGMQALAHSAEGAEDDVVAGRDAVAEAAIGPDDVVIGVAASGRTPFTLAVVEAARASGALTIAVANNADTPLLNAAEHALLAATGSEIIAGSTRMKAGTAQKAILNMLSTAIMLRLGRVYKGLMVDMQVSNDKLLGRAATMVASLASCSIERAGDALVLTGNNIKAAVLVASGLSPEAARTLLAKHQDLLRPAIEGLGSEAS